MGTASLSTRMPVVAEIVDTLENKRHALISGPSGSGKSHVLRDLSVALQGQGRPVVDIDCADPAARAALIAQHSPASDGHAVFLLDNFEQADSQTLHALLDRDANGRLTVASLETGNQHTPYLRALEQVLSERESAAPAIAAIRHFPLHPLPDHEVAWLLHELSPAMLNSTTVHTVTTLAAGRPAWVLDLLVLAEAGALIHVPQPGIVEHIPRELNLPGMRAIVRSVGVLSPPLASAALLSSELGPTDITMLEDQFGARTVRELSERGVVTREPESDRYTVLPFAAAALRPYAAPELVSEGRQIIAERLIVQDALGLPLTTSETLRCARGVLLTGDDFSPLPHREARTRVLRRATMSSLALRQDSQARAFLLKSGAADAPLPLESHAQVIGALVSSLAAVDLLDASPQSAQASGSPHDDTTRRSALRASLSDDSGVALRSRSATDQVTRWWNTTEALSSAHSALRQLADTAEPETAALAAALFELDTVWRGKLPRGSWLAHGGPLPALPTHPHGPDDVVAGTLLLARGLTAFLAGELATRVGEIRALAAATATPEAHLRWIRHLIAANEALACGHGERAALEWCLLEQSAPRYLARRLCGYLRTISSSIAAASDPADSPLQNTPALAPQYFTRYLTGQHTALRLGEFPVLVDDETLPVLRFAQAHLTAAAQRNPVELLRAAKRLQRLEFWAPAAFAASTARTIYLSRRTISGVRECDQQLDALEYELSQSVAWYRSGTLPTVQFARLTPRELEVARLAAQGIPNAALAARLSCSVRTIESHLAQARAKLGAQSRDELAEKLGLDRSAPPSSREIATKPQASSALRAGTATAQRR